MSEEGYQSQTRMNPSSELGPPSPGLIPACRRPLPAAPKAQHSAPDEKGYISNPQSKAKSVVFTEEGLERAKRLLAALFGKRA